MSADSPEHWRSVPAEPRAARIQAPGWRNPRLLIGLLLVFSSIAVGARVMAAADRTAPVFAASRALPTGTVLSDSDLTVVRLRLTGTQAAYLDARKPIPAGRVLIRPVGEGELVPAAALVTASQLRMRPVSIPINGPLPSGLRAGGLVDVWASAKASSAGSASSADGTGGTSGAPSGGYLDAQRIASSVEVSGVESESRSLSASSAATVQILVESRALPVVLNALANDAQIAVLPIPGVSPVAGVSG